MIVARKCDECEENYDADTRYLKRDQGKFCSRLCSATFNGKALRVVHEPNVSCSWCSVTFYKSPAHQKNSKSGMFFCTKEHQNLAYGDRNHEVSPGPVPTKTIKICTNCNTRHRSKADWCGKCDKQVRIALWLAGDNSVTLGGGRTMETRDFVKEYLLSVRGDKCEQCGWDEKAPDGRSIIQMDHIDGNYMNNLIDNLKLLCANHHAMTPTYGSLNKNGGRAHRRKDFLR